MYIDNISNIFSVCVCVVYFELLHEHRIMKTKLIFLFGLSPCNEDPLTPHFYIVKLGCTGVYIISYFCSKTYIVGTR